ncbi:hypothetical protein H4582DRAFT_1959873 [Lactarius indigo]|nr:hypothetical protein H4582DRAFT_1959873 [Lactarius indigo]
MPSQLLLLLLLRRCRYRSSSRQSTTRWSSSGIASSPPAPAPFRGRCSYSFLRGWARRRNGNLLGVPPNCASRHCVRGCTPLRASASSYNSCDNPDS